jgi:hypothetical protein
VASSSSSREAVEEPAFLMAVQRIIGRVEVEDDLA